MKHITISPKTKNVINAIIGIFEIPLIVFYKFLRSDQNRLPEQPYSYNAEKLVLDYMSYYRLLYPIYRNKTDQIIKKFFQKKYKTHEIYSESMESTVEFILWQEKVFEDLQLMAVYKKYTTIFFAFRIPLGGVLYKLGQELEKNNLNKNNQATFEDNGDELNNNTYSYTYNIYNNKDASKNLQDSEPIVMKEDEIKKRSVKDDITTEIIVPKKYETFNLYMSNPILFEEYVRYFRRGKNSYKPIYSAVLLYKHLQFIYEIGKDPFQIYYPKEDQNIAYNKLKKKSLLTIQNLWVKLLLRLIDMKQLLNFCLELKKIYAVKLV